MKTILKNMPLILCLTGLQFSIKAQSKCKDDAYAGQEWTGEWETNFGKRILAQKGISLSLMD